MVCGACMNAQAFELAWRWTVGMIAIMQRLHGIALAAFDAAACADYDQPARPGADSDPAIFFLSTGARVKIA